MNDGRDAGVHDAPLLDDKSTNRKSAEFSSGGASPAAVAFQRSKTCPTSLHDPALYAAAVATPPTILEDDDLERVSEDEGEDASAEPAEDVVVVQVDDSRGDHAHTRAHSHSYSATDANRQSTSAFSERSSTLSASASTLALAVSPIDIGTPGAAVGPWSTSLYAGPIVAMTAASLIDEQSSGFTNHELQGECDRAGFTSCLSKPILIDDLRKALEELITIR